METSHTSRFFLQPKTTFQRQYEALRAIFVDGEPIDQVADRLGYKSSTLRVMASRFRGDCRQGITPPFFPTTDADDHSEPARPKTRRAPNHPKWRTVES